MGKRLLCLALIMGLGLGGFALWQRSAVAGQDQDRIAQLLKQLGSSKYAEREKAKRELETIGLPALEQLRKAAKEGDLETTRRCQELIKKFEGKLAADVLLAPKKVNLNLKDVTVMQAVEELQKQSGYQIIIDGDRTALAKRTMTLVTGEVTFWEAFDKLCEAAKLSEVPTATNPYAVYPPAVDQPVPIKPRPIKLPVQPQPQPLILPAPNPPLQLQFLPLQQPQPNPAGQVIELQVQVELPAAGANGKAVAAKVAMPVQVGGGQGGGIQIQPGQAVGGVQPAPAQIRPGQAQPGQAQPVPIQPGKLQPVQPIQIQPGQMQPLPGTTKVPARYNQPGIIVVRDGTPEKIPTCYHGALRIRLLPASRASIAVQPRKEGEALFILEVDPEPRLQQFSVVGSPRLDKAMDDQGQELALVMEPMGSDPTGLNVSTRTVYYSPYGGVLQRQVALRLKLSEKHAKNLKQLTGTLTVQALSANPEAIISVDEVLKAAGKTAKGQSGGSIEVVNIEKQAGGKYRVQVRYQNPPQFFPVNGPVGAPVPAAVPAGAVQIQGGAAGSGRVKNPNVNQGLPVLVDAKGKSWTLDQITQRVGRAVNGQYTQEITMVFRADQGVGEPAQMVLFGHRMVTAEVPFRFENVHLPQ
jgi:hypothetical protein